MGVDGSGEAGGFFALDTASLGPSGGNGPCVLVVGPLVWRDSTHRLRMAALACPAKKPGGGCGVDFGLHGPVVSVVRAAFDRIMTGLRTLDTDILILGAGGAGMFAALHAHQANPDLRIAIVAKGLLGKCGCTRMVQGGYNVALSPGDSLERHFMDTIIGGKWLPHQEMAWTLVETAIVRVRELENELGCFFDRNPDGSLHHKAFAGQTFDRTVHKGDLTGVEIINRLMEKIRALPLTGLEEHRALGLLPDRSGERIGGVLMVDMRSGEFRLVRARAVLLATGGGPSMYRYHTPSGDKSMDGLAMALRLGLPLRDMEMVQFHPTGLLAGENTRMTGTILEEGLRGAGGYLLNGNGHRFMQDYDPAAERSTRDIVSRSMYNEMRAGRGTPLGGIYLTLSHLDPDAVRAKFPGMVRRCSDCGFDLINDRVEVVPTAHYLMGGLLCDVHTRTRIKGLYVAGEDAGGMHGANRLGGNGVANSTVFGGIAGETMAADLAADDEWGGLVELDPDAIDRERDRALRPLHIPAGNLSVLRQRLMDLMWTEAGIIRTREGLERGKAGIRALRQDLDHTGIGGGQSLAFNLSWHDWLNLENLLDLSEVICQAALARENSRGAHYREDFTAPGDLASSTFTVIQRDQADLTVSQWPVEFTLIRPGSTLLREEIPSNGVTE